MKKAIFLAVLATVAMGSAQAAPVVFNFDFTLSGFTDINGSPALPSPVSQISGSITAVFDTNFNTLNSQAGLGIHNLTGFAPASPPSFSYFAAEKLFFFGGIQNGASFVVTGTTDLILSLDLSNLSAPQFVLCNEPGFSCGTHTGDANFAVSGFTTAGTNSLWFISAPDSSVSLTTPLPAALPLFATGLGVLGLLGWRRKRKPA